MTFQTLQLWRNAPGTFSSSIAMLKTQDILLFIDLPLIALLLRKPLLHYRSNITACIITIVTGLFLFSVKPVINNYSSKPWWSPESPYENAVNWGAIGFHLIDTYKALADKKFLTLSNAQKDSVAAWLQSNRMRNHSNNFSDFYFAKAQGKNIIIIQCESMGGFVINNKYKGNEITPNLNSLITTSMYFNDYHSQNKYGGSADAEFILYTSLYPIAAGSVFFRFPAFSDLAALPLLLKRKGYSTAVMHDNVKSFWNRGLAYQHLGIDSFFDRRDIAALSASNHLDSLSSDDKLFRCALIKLQTQPQPFFFQIITIDTHLATDTKNVDQYLDKVSRLDQILGTFFTALKNAGLYDKTIIVVYGDHPPYINVPDLIKEDSSYSWMKYSGRLVPMIIHVPGLEATTISTIGGQIDAYPTIAHLLGLEPESYSKTIMGHNLLSGEKGFVVHWPGNYLGDIPSDSNEYQMRLQGYHISNLIIRGSYFGK
ncbi:MAG TPA: LTA synthase family protein [Chitinispirillaceae bacterium]|nr:LTA synthase family protein [Chitinispirillaceae bacterium]